MEFIFGCPKHNRTFTSADFEIIGNHGVVREPSGNRYLDAKVKLSRPCPFCGEKHIYHASELSCPFENPKDG